MDPSDTDTERRTGRAPVAVLAAGALAVLIAVGAGLSGPLRFTGPRWLPDLTSTPQPIVQTQRPRPQGTPTAATSTAAHHGPNLTWLVLLVAALVVLVAILLVIRWLLRRRRDRPENAATTIDDVPGLLETPEDPSVETSLPYLRRGLRRALAALDGDRVPSDAIVEAWLGLQEAAEDAGFQRGDSETPTEFTSRILRRVEVDAVALSTLRRLYLPVRFGDARATPADVDAARAALQTLQSQWDHEEETP